MLAVDLRTAEKSYAVQVCPETSSG